MFFSLISSEEGEAFSVPENTPFAKSTFFLSREKGSLSEVPGRHSLQLE